MLPQYSTTQLIENIKRRCLVPTSQLTYRNQDFCLLANDELQGTVVPLMMSAREEYFVTFEDIAVPETRVITIPKSAAGAKLRSVCYVQAGSPLVLINLPRIDLDVIAGVGFTNYNTLAGFYIQGNDLVLYPNTSVPVNTTIRLYYYKRTLVLASPEAYGRIVAINEIDNSFQLSATPFDWAAGTKLNSVSSEPGFSTTNPEMTVISINNPTVFVDTVADVSVGDYVSDMGFSAIPQVPVEAHPYLAQLTAAKCLEGLGDSKGMEVALGKAEMLKKGILTLMSQRVDGSVKKIMNPTGGLRLGAGLGIWGRGGTGGYW